MQGKCEWMKKVYEVALMMSNLINGSDKVRTALDEKQLQRPDGKVRAVATHNPTRFGTMHFITKDLYREGTRKAITDLVMDEERDFLTEVAKDCEAREAFNHAVRGTTRLNRQRPFKWRHMALAIELADYICDALHQIETDKPRLGWLLPFWAELIGKVRAFDEEHSEELGNERVEGIVRARFEKHYDKSWSAACFVDPIFGVQRTQGWYLGAAKTSAGKDVLSVAKLEDALECLQELCGADNKEAVEAEWSRLTLAPLPASMARHMPALIKRQVVDGREEVATAALRQGFWDQASGVFPLIAAAAIRLLAFHATSCSSERNWSRWGHLCTKARNRRLLERSEKLVAIMASGGRVSGGDESDAEIMLSLLEAAASSDSESDSEVEVL
jgi:hypothetical protein